MDKDKVIVTGSNGQLARCMKYVLSLRGMDFLCDYEYVFTTRDNLDITSEESIEKFMSTQENVKYIVNCAAFTNVERCNIDSKDCVDINVNGVKNLSLFCKKNNIFLITFGSDYMYNISENRPILETDEKNPLNTYGSSKMYGYYKLCEIYNPKEYEDHFLFINTSWLYSEFGNNFVKKMYNAVKRGEKKKIVLDQVGTPTYAQNLASFVIDFIEMNNKPKFAKNGILNFAGKGIASWYDLAKEVEILTKENNALDSLIQPCLTADIKSKIRRPSYSPLSTKLLEDTFGVDAYTRHWREDLDMCIKNLKLMDKYRTNKGAE